MNDEENKFVCPKCLKQFEDDLEGDYPRGRKATVYCPDCDTVIEADVQTHWWLTQNDGDFTKIFLQSRGFDFARVKQENINLNWVENYLERFIEGQKDEVDIWSSPECRQAYLIVLEYWGIVPKEFVQTQNNYTPP